MFTIVQAGTAFKILDTDGSVYTTLTLPTGVTVDATIRAQFTSLAGRLIITRAPSVNLWVDPRDFTVRPLAVLPPLAAPTIASAAGTGLTGTYYAAYSYIVQINGIVVQESQLSPISGAITLADDIINWSNLVPSSESHVTGYRLYRTVAGGDPSVMFLAQEVGNQTDTTFSGDNVLDAALSLLPSPQGGNAPGGTTPGTRLKLCIEWGDRLWGVADDDDLRHYVYYTESGDPFAWRSVNRFLIPVGGEDEFGVTGFLRRRDELVVGKRRRFCKIIGSSATDFEVIILAEGPGVIAGDSCVVIDDVGYALGEEGVWKVGPDGVTSASDGKVATWFQTDQQYEPSAQQYAAGGHNPLTQTYDIHQLFTAGDVDGRSVNGWSSYMKDGDEWTGTHYTDGVTPVSRGTRYNTDGQLVPVLGGRDGYVYDMNLSAAYDLTGGSTSPVGIIIDWRTKPHSGGEPDLFHVFRQPAIFQRAQGDGAGNMVVKAYVGDYDERTMRVATYNSIVPPIWSVDVPLSKARVTLPRIGYGVMAQLVFRHNFVANAYSGLLEGNDNLTSDVELWGIEIPFVTIGRR